MLLEIVGIGMFQYLECHPDIKKVVARYYWSYAALDPRDLESDNGN